jgi:hypothetical protein
VLATQSGWLRYIAWADQALAHCTDATPPETVLLLKSSLLDAYQTLRPLAAVELGEELLPLLRQAGDPLPLGQALAGMANALRFLGRRAESRACVEEAEMLIAALPASRMAAAVRLAGAFIFYMEDPARTHALLRSAAQQARSIGADGWAALLTTYLLLSDDDSADVETALAESRAVMEQIRPTHMFADAVMGQACIAVAFRLAQRNAPGDLDEAWRVIRNVEKTQGRTVQFVGVRSFVALALSDARPADAARIYGALIAAAAQLGYSWDSFSGIPARARRHILEHLSEPQLERFAAEGALLGPDEFYALATNRAP